MARDENPITGVGSQKSYEWVDYVGGGLFATMGAALIGFSTYQLATDVNNLNPEKKLACIGVGGMGTGFFLGGLPPFIIQPDDEINWGRFIGAGVYLSLAGMATVGTAAIINGEREGGSDEMVVYGSLFTALNAGALTFLIYNDVTDSNHDGQGLWGNLLENVVFSPNGVSTAVSF